MDQIYPCNFSPPRSVLVDVRRFRANAGRHKQGESIVKLKAEIVFGAIIASLGAMGAHADPVALNESQMDSVAAVGIDTIDGFVCPVITTENVLHSPKAGAIGEGHYTIGGPDVSIPLHATNGDGSGSPQGPHSEPGNTDYTAIWAR